MPSRPIPAPPPASLPLAAAAHHHHPSLARLRVLFIALTVSFSSLFLLALLFFLLYLYFSLLDRSSPTLPFDAAPAVPATPARPPGLRLRRFFYRELRAATGGFDAAHSLGRGGSGFVFRGVLPDGKTVAVKRVDPAAPGPSSASVSAAAALAAEREFQNELQVLGGISSPYVVSLMGYCMEKKRKLLVYEYMPNRSLQEALFGGGGSGVGEGGSGGRSPDLDWDRRFKIILDVAQGLAFLHLECDPPVIHGDIKPSNVLLGSDFRAKISDFGLSRIKSEGPDLGFELYSQDLGRSEELWKSQELPPGNPPDSPKVDFSLALKVSSNSKKRPKHRHEDSRGSNDCFPKGKESAPCDDELSSVDFSRELNGNAISTSPIDDGKGDANQLGNDWWWRQDGTVELCSKDYVQEWIGSQICPSRNPDWDDDKKSSPKKSDVDGSYPMEKLCGGKGDPGQRQFSSFHSYLNRSEDHEAKGGGGDGGVCDKKHKKMREWWKEEYFSEIDRKGMCRRARFRWFPSGGRSSHEGAEGDSAGAGVVSNMDISFRKGWKKRKKQQRSRSAGSDVWSGDLFLSRELSSTTSMRGTVCYVAPEYGGCGYLMEKADIYSFGVLVLVIVSGRRPLHVLSSPMKLERANLISWCRQLAHAGTVLELVDERLKEGATGYDKEQAALCINLALLCLQRIPELRPDSGEIVKILKGEMELPPLPMEFSPSPSSRLFARSRRKAASEAELATC
ncbi:hypothetical protein Taro_038906 [Colocasia esculenta]|uniref:Protein kinase domain-containing protein n=1 Tax=Colocasia esculenta TaxID=4460 RepID=A0A843WU32_COLES|nr:hypothetical protein [Colocasia esculenta]